MTFYVWLAISWFSLQSFSVYMGQVNRRIKKNHRLHMDYLDIISDINNEEIQDHLYDYNWRYDWLADARKSFSPWKIWQSIEDCYPNKEKVLTRRGGEYFTPTYVIPTLTEERVKWATLDRLSKK